MNYELRKIEQKDTEELVKMMTDFYSSGVVSSSGSEDIFRRDINECLDNSPYLDGYVFLCDSQIAGYSMVAKSFSTESGRKCMWLEDLYLKPEFRGRRIIPRFIEQISNYYPNAIFKLEVTADNSHAIHVYKKMGFHRTPYLSLRKHSANYLKRLHGRGMKNK